MAAPKRTRTQREYDLKEIAELYLKGWYQYQILDYITENRPYNVTRQTLHRDLKTIQSRWLDSSLIDFNEAKALALAKIDHLETVAWQDYANSKDPAIKRKVSKKVDGQTTEATQEMGQGFGDTKFLDIVKWTIDRRIKLLGLDPKGDGSSDEKPFIIKVLRGVSMDDL